MQKFYQIHTLSPFLKNITNILNKDDLVIFDVDDVLIKSIDPFYYIHYKNKTELGLKFHKASTFKKNAFYEYNTLNKPYQILEKDLPSLILTIQKLNIRTLALTALNPIITEKINFAQWRANHLKRFNIFFNKNFTYINNNYINGNKPPFFYDGILFSGQYKKNICLSLFLKKIKTLPTTIIFIDDKLQNIIPMLNTFNNGEFKLIAIHYTAKFNKNYKKTFNTKTFISYLKKQENFLKNLLIN